MQFMRRFGYLSDTESSPPLIAEALYSEAAIVEALKTVQQFGALPETGVLDEATIYVII